MKIVCQSCSAKYSIADDKVQGKKVFKIKCKKCGEDILVRGAEAGGDPEVSAGHGMHESSQEPFSEDEATRVVSSDMGDAVWHVVVNGDQQGPFSLKQLRDMVANGSITADTFVWKDGFADWKALRDVPELATLAIGAPAAPAAASPSLAGDDLFGSPAAATDGGLFGSAPAAAAAKSAAAPVEARARTGSKATAGTDLFGRSTEEEEVSTSASASPRVETKPTMTGQRNENSVLFSLATLQQVAGAAASSAAKVSEPGAAGKASADQSGLIDIKSMAAAFGSGSGNKQKAIDEILTVGGGGALAAPLAAPVLAPVPTPAAVSAEPEKAQGTNKTVLFAVIAVAVILAGGVVSAALLLRGSNNNTSTPTVAVPTPTPAPVAAPTSTSSPSANAETPTTGTAVATNTNTNTSTNTNTESAAGTNRASGESSGRERAGRSESRGARERTGSSAGGSSSPAGGSSATVASNNAPTPSGGPSGGTCAQRCRGNIDCLLRCSTEGPTSRPAAPSAAASNDLPETPSRSDVLAAMRAVTSAVTACGNGQTGTANVTIIFASSGRVTTANVAPPFAGTPAGSCIARAVRSATVPPFSRPTFQVNYPFVIR